MTGTSLVLHACRVPDRAGLFDVALRDGRIEAIVPAADAPPNGPALALDGRLLLPALADGHIHLDKSFMGLPWRPHRPGQTIAARIAAERAERTALAGTLAERARRLVERIIGFGTLAVRSHADVDADAGLRHVETLLALREAYADRIDIQLVAFPQSGIGVGVAELLDEALRMGVEVIGGLDPAGIDHDVDAHLDTVFGLAERHGCRIDIHLHDPGSLGASELRQIASRTEALGLHGRVAVSHAFALGMVDERELAATAGALARAGVAIMTSGPGADAMPPLRRLWAEGVTVFAGCDNIRDAWSPFGTGDALHRASLIAYRADFRADEELEAAFDLVTGASRAVMGCPPVAIAAGSPADLIAVAAETVAEAVASPPAERVVIRRGRLVPSG